MKWLLAPFAAGLALIVNLHGLDDAPCRDQLSATETLNNDEPLDACQAPPEASLAKKIGQIQIPGVNFFDTPLSKVLSTLSAYSRLQDPTEPNPAAKGVMIITMPQGAPEPKVTIQLNKMSLGRMLDFITEMVNWEYEVRGNAVVVHPPQRKVEGKAGNLVTRFFELSQGMIQRMTGGRPAGPRPGTAPDPFGGGRAAAPNDQAARIKDYFLRAGVAFDEKKGHKFVFDGFQVIATHDQASLEKMTEILLALDENIARQISVTCKFIESPQGTLDAIFRKLGVAEGVVSGTQIESDLATKALEALLEESGVELRYSPRVVTMDGLAASISVGEEMIYPTDFQQRDGGARGKPDQQAPVPRFGKVAPDDEDPGFRHVGVKVDLAPRHDPKYDRIQIELIPKITEFLGYEEFGAGIKVPKFWTWKLSTSVTLGRKKTMIFRGPAQEKNREILFLLEARAMR